MKKLSYSLWFEDKVEQAAEFYATVFDGKVLGTTPNLVETPSNKPVGSMLLATVEIEGSNFELINGGPGFAPNPSISFFVSRDSKAEIDKLWSELSSGGQVRMELDEYPFSNYYGWVEDKYGVNWQLILPGADGDWRPRLVPSLMFVGDQAGRAQEAMEFYLEVFKDSELGNVNRYGENPGPDDAENISYGDFKLGDQWLAVMDSAHPDHEFQFSEGVSLVINCEDQAEVDYYWQKLSAQPEVEQCGWLRDKFGVSWQVIPVKLNELINSDDKNRATQAMENMLEMKKIVISEL